MRAAAAVLVGLLLGGCACGNGRALSGTTINLDFAVVRGWRSAETRVAGSNTVTVGVAPEGGGTVTAKAEGVPGK